MKSFIIHIIFIATLFVSTSFAQQCLAYSCTECLDAQSVCQWCLSNNTCFNPYDNYTVCRDKVTSQPLCPYDVSLQVDSFIIGSLFCSLYIIIAIAMVGIYVSRRRTMKRIIAAHFVRQDHLDFSALGSNSIEDIVQDSITSREQLLWCDVRLAVAHWTHLLPGVLSFLFSIIVLGATSNVEAQLYCIPIFIIAIVPGMYYVIIGSFRIIKKHHYIHIYGLTTTGAFIIYQKFRCLAPKKYKFSYKNMISVVAVEFDSLVGSVYFAKSLEKPKNEDRIFYYNYDEGTRATLMSTEDIQRLRVGFQNIVRFKEVEQMVRDQITKQSPSFNAQTLLSTP